MSLCRLVFGFIQILNTQTITPILFLKSIFYGLYMDLSIYGYLMVPLCLIILMGHLLKWINIKKCISFYTYFVIFLMATIYGIDSILYQEWGFRIDDTFFNYIDKSNEAGKFISSNAVVYFLLYFTIFIVIGIYIIKWISAVKPFNLSIKNGLIILLLIPMMIIPIRGGFGLAPMNPGKVYYSNSMFANHLAIHPLWNIMYMSLQNRKMATIPNHMTELEAKDHFDTLLLKNSNHTFQWLKTQEPDILLIILESFTANMLDAKYQGIEILPNLNVLKAHGIFMKNAYASGDRTDKGLAAIISSYPAQPQSSIIKYPSKAEQLPSIYKQLKMKKYRSSFYYGGDISFASMKSYLLGASVDRIIDKYDFDASTYNAKWGVHDHILFEKMTQDLLKEPRPFIMTGLSLSSHPPYDIPDADVWNEKDETTLFVNAAHYTDKALGKMVEQLKQSERWDSLLIIIVADHGGRYPDKVSYCEPKKFSIPILFTGGAVSLDTVIQSHCSQTDISATLLRQMNISFEPFKYSQDIFSPQYSAFAYYAFNNGMGWMDSGGYRIYSNDKKDFIEQQGSCYFTEAFIKAYSQIVQKDFTEK